jgi:hypothetical protein
MRGEITSVRVAKMPGSSSRKRRGPFRAPLKKEGADLIDDAGVLTGHSLADAMQRL